MLLGDRQCLLFWICVKRREKPASVLCLRLAEGTLTQFAVHVRFGISRSSLREHFQAWEACKSGEDAFYKADTLNVKTRKCSHSEQKLFMCFLLRVQQRKGTSQHSLFSRNFLQTLVSLSIELVTCRAAPRYILYYAVNSRDLVNPLKPPPPLTRAHIHNRSHTHTSSYSVD